MKNKTQKKSCLKLSLPKAFLVLSAIKENIYISELCKETDTTNSHVTKIINTFETMQFIKKELNGRKKLIHILAKGRKYIDSAYTLKTLFGKIKDEKENIIF
jgi:DNA-binding MarR family transcriptional regulator